jgi:hypothetical protein
VLVLGRCIYGNRMFDGLHRISVYIDRMSTARSPISSHVSLNSEQWLGGCLRCRISVDSVFRR